MIIGYQEQSRKSASDCIECRKFSYASCLEYSEKNGIVAEMPSQTAAITHNTNDNTYQPGDPDKELLNEEGLFGRGLLQYRKWWELNEVDIVVNGAAITGIPIFIDKNTLRVVNNTYSYFIPLEKIDYIRTPDGLKNAVKNNE